LATAVIGALVVLRLAPSGTDGRRDPVVGRKRRASRRVSGGTGYARGQRFGDHVVTGEY